MVICEINLIQFNIILGVIRNSVKNGLERSKLVLSPGFITVGAVRNSV